jgi:hypothetical protein
MSSSFQKFAVRFIAVIALVMLAGGAIHAQSTTYGAIGGIAIDPQDKVIVGATVTVRNVATNATSEPVKTESNGRFLITNLVPGMYEITVTAANFAEYKQPNIIVEIGRTTDVPVKTVLAGQQQTISVVAEAPVINNEANDFSTNVNTTAIANLPISIRRWSYFALSTPGAVPDGTFGDISFRGISGLLNNNTVDGADNNEAFFSEEKGRTRIDYSSSLNSIQEFQVNTSNYSAEYGHAAGGVVNAVTKSGSNTLHGDVFFYDRDARLFGAYAPFNTGAVQSSPGVFTTVPLRPKDERLQFGADAGGWIFKDKLFWYISGDGVVRNFPAVAIPTGPATFFQGITVAAPSGTNPDGSPESCSDVETVKGVPNTVAQQGTYSGNNGFTPKSTSPAFAGTNPLTIGQVLFCRGITQTEVNTSLGFLDSLTGTVPRTGDQSIYFPKLDWHLNKNNVITLSWNRLRWASPFGIQTATNVSRGIDSFGNDYVKDDTFLVRWTSNWGSNISNELRLSYGRDFEFELSTPPPAGEPISPLTGFSPQISFSGYGPNVTGGISFTFGAPSFLQRADYPNETKYQATDVFSWTVGKHLIKAGFDFYRTGDRISNLFEGLGVYSYSNMADFISDYVATTTSLNPGGTPGTLGMVCQSNTAASGAPPVLVYVPCYSSMTQGFGPAGLDVITWDPAVFVQDDWHVTRKLTIDAGLRWENEYLPKNPNVIASLPLTGVMPNYTKNFGPRIGFALDTFGNGKTVVRGGFGVYYGRIINEQIFGVMAENGDSVGNTALSQLTNQIFPTQGSNNSAGALTVGAPTYPNLNTSFKSGTPSTLYFAGDARLPQVYQYDMVVEHEISANTVISASYLGAYGRFLPMGIDQNLPPGLTTLNYTIAGTIPAASTVGPLQFLGGASTETQFPVPGSVFTVPYYPGGNAARPNTSFQQIIELSTSAKSWYSALVLQVNRRLTRGLQFNVSYTWSHAIDTDQQSAAIITSNTPLNVANIALDRGNSNFDIRNRALATLVWQPEFFGKGSSNKMAHWVLDGWTLSPIVTISSGLPFSAGVSGNAPGTNLGEIGASGSSRVAFIGRNSFRFPGISNTDLRLARSFDIRERIKLELSAEAFNLFNQFDVTALNTTLFAASGTSTSNATLTYQSTFDTPTAANNGTFLTQRLLQFGARVTF